MFALVGVVFSYATFAAGASAGGVTAPDDIALCWAAGGPSCETPAVDQAGGDYATPAQVDCPAVGAARDAQSRIEAGPTFVKPAFWDCSPPVLDFHYRVSRAPESERPNGALRPQRARRGSPVAACTGLPAERGSPLSLGTVQPAAMYALLSLIPPSSTAAHLFGGENRLTRALEPLDRPPRY